jgi:hypothetical protein
MRKNTASIAAAAALAAALALAGPASAATVAIDPVSDGSLYGGDTVVDNQYVLTSGGIQGDVKFSMAALGGPRQQVLLTLNAYALPLWGPDVEVYGYRSDVAALAPSDAVGDAFLGTLVLPVNLGFGQDAAFDVTSFVDATTAAYVGFDLRSDGTDVFSSLEYNDGHPSQLVATAAVPAPVPEPAPAALGLAGLTVLASVARRRGAAAR